MRSSDSENSAHTQQPSTGTSRIGLLGGTFNPIHNGHLTIARQTRELLGLDRILFIPTGDPPHKLEKDLAPAKDRYEMARLAIAEEPAFVISDVETRRPGKSYSVDTVRLLQQECGPQAHLSFLIGLDAFLDVPNWREPHVLLQLCSFVVINRPGISFQALTRLTILQPPSRQSLADLDAGRISKLESALGSQQLTCLRLPPCDISASDIRRKVHQGLSVANLLPPSVESYIIQHHLY
jgi:nicotinate-nucleotide adenylyltransferase